MLADNALAQSNHKKISKLEGQSIKISTLQKCQGYERQGKMEELPWTWESIVMRHQGDILECKNKTTTTKKPKQIKKT
jgi:hypothetical protein